MLSRLRDPFAAGALRARNKAFLEAAMASAAFIASTDDQVSFARRHALDRVLESVDRLKAFEVHAAVDLFDDFVRQFGVAPEPARARVLKAISAMADQADAVELLVRIAGAVARADGEVSAEARARVGEIARTLGVAEPEAGRDAVLDADARRAGQTVIVLGNEKGGTGKSTTAMHLAVALAEAGHRVGSLDLDGRQATLSRYVSNRKTFAKKHDLEILMPVHRRIERSEARDREAAEREERARFDQALAELADCQFVVIDTPGTDSLLCRLGHGRADILITPLNDSFLDIDVLARIDRDRHEVVEPSPYSRMIGEQNERRLAEGRAPIEWIVMRNRLAHIDARNTREMAQLLERLSKRMGFRLEPGLSERVVFRELFYHGLTLMDLPEDPKDARANASRLRARREVRELVRALGVRASESIPEHPDTKSR
jgi:chromosome partitioning protein